MDKKAVLLTDLKKVVLQLSELYATNMKIEVNISKDNKTGTPKINITEYNL